VNNLFPENSSNSQPTQPFFSLDPKQKRADYQHRSGSLSPLKLPKYERKSFIPETPVGDEQQQDYGGGSELVLEDLRDCNLIIKKPGSKSPNMKYSKSSSLRGHKKTNNSPQPSMMEDSDDEIILEEAKDGIMFAPRKLTNTDQMRVMKASTDTVSSKPFDETDSPRAFHLSNLSELQQRARAISVPKPSSKLRIVKNLYINNHEEEQERQIERKGYGEYSTHSLRSSLQVGMPIIINPEPRHAETEVTDRSGKKNGLFIEKRESLVPLKFTQLRDTSNHKKWAESVKAKARESAYRYNHNSSVIVGGDQEKSHNSSQLYRTPKERKPVGFYERTEKTPEPPVKLSALEKETKASVVNENNKRLKNKAGLKLQGEFMNGEKEPNHQYLRTDTGKLKSLGPSSLTKEKPEQPKLTSDQRYEKLMVSCLSYLMLNLLLEFEYKG